MKLLFDFRRESAGVQLLDTFVQQVVYEVVCSPTDSKCYELISKGLLLLFSEAAVLTLHEHRIGSPQHIKERFQLLVQALLVSFFVALNLAIDLISLVHATFQLLCL